MCPLSAKGGCHRLSLSFSDLGRGQMENKTLAIADDLLYA